MHRRVGAPGAPLFGKLFQLFRPGGSGCAQQPKVGGRERVWLCKRTHRDILRGPFTDSGQGAKALHETGWIDDTGENYFFSVCCESKLADGLGPRHGQTDGRVVGGGERGGRREYMGESATANERRSESLGQTAGEGASAFHADLLAEDRTHGQLESVPCAWNAETGPGCNAFA